MARKGKTAPKRRGRPPLPPGKGKRASFTTRMTPRLKETLEGSAKANGRSLSEEIEHRLQLSIKVDLRDLQNIEKKFQETINSVVLDLLEGFNDRSKIDGIMRRIREGK